MWKLINKSDAIKYFTHYIFMNDVGQIAIADHSIRDLHNPASTDDGLLIVNLDTPVQVRLSSGTSASLSVTNDKGERKIVITSLLTPIRLGLPL